MLIAIDKVLNRAPSKFINLVTGGTKGSSMCARLYLYKRYISNSNYLVNSLMFLIDLIEKKHCYVSARYWRSSYRKLGVVFPECYVDFIVNYKEVGNEI
jgi:hypothetical protein